MTATQRAEMLAVARELIVHGWTQHAYVRSGSGFAVAIDTKRVRRVCGAGAIDRVGITHGLTYAERDELRGELRASIDADDVNRLAGCRGRDDDLLLERWNDEPGRTRNDVLDLYDKTIRRLLA